MKMNEGDFDRLWDTSMAWGREWLAQDGRFDPPVSYDWKQAYWFELSYSNLIFAKSFLEDKGYDYEVAADEAGGWVILTNYVSQEVMV